MENMELAKAVSTSSPNTTQNDCCEDGEHVINQIQQTLDNSNVNSEILDLAESSAATNECNSINKALGEHLAPCADIKMHNKPNDDAPVDLTSVSIENKENAADETQFVQTEPFNLKVDAVSSQHIKDDTLIANETSTATTQPPLIDLVKNSTTNNATTETFQKQVSLTSSQHKTTNNEDNESDSTNKTKLLPQQESILDLRINNTCEETKSESDATYQASLNEIKVENTLESQESAFCATKEQQAVEKVEPESLIKLNGSHRYSPTSESCETNFQNSEAVEQLMPEKSNEQYETIKPLIATNLEQQLCSASFSNSFPEKQEVGVDDGGGDSNGDCNTSFPNSFQEEQKVTVEDGVGCNVSFSNSFQEQQQLGINDGGDDDDTATTKELNESRYSFSDSLHSALSMQSSSSHQLVIDQPAEDEKVPPLRLKLKRKPRKSSSSAETVMPAKRPHIETADATNTTVLPTLETTNLQNLQSTDDFELQTEDDSHTNALADISTISTHNNIFKANENVVTKSLLDKTQAEPAPQQQQLQTEIHENHLTFAENIEPLKPPPIAAQYFKCTSCGTFHENWSFFLHLQEKHDRFLCLYCIKCFPTAEKLALHLEIKHDLEQNHFNTEEAFRNSALIIHGFSLETRFLMCCTCQYIFRESAAFTEHACIEFMKSCMLCGQKGRHTNQCKANPIAKRRNKKKTRQKPKTSGLEPIPQQMEQTPCMQQQLLPPPAPPLQSSLAPALNELPAPMQQTLRQSPKKTPIRRQTDDSNSSSNMVIDESCNTNHNLLSNQINPFTALDETERMEQEEAARNQQQEDASQAGSNVFKLKLRVPKEFQKPVDEEISTSESEHAEGEVEAEVYEDENAADINSNQVEYKNNILEAEGKATYSDDKVLNSSRETTTQQQQQSEEESIDDTLANEHLARILQEIEQTKLDIEKTKETLQQRHATQQQTKSESNFEMNTKESNVDVVGVDVGGDDGDGNKHWTPTPPVSPKPVEKQLETLQPPTENMESLAEDSAPAENIVEAQENAVDNVAIEPAPPHDGIEVANEDCLLIELQLDRPIDQFEIVEFVRICLKAAYPYCLYCNHARRIAVNAESLVLHILAQHRFMATVDSITAEELQPSTLVARLKSFLPALRDHYINSSSYCTIGNGRFTRHFNERIFECFQCRFVTTTHKELYLHNRKMHLRTAILCFMCRCNFYSFSEILCHICPGVPHRVSIFEIKFRCFLCDLTEIPSPFRLMVHLRKRHFACDICLEDCRDQSKLSSHVWKHKLHNLCYRCGIAYRNKLDITKHLFWKHGTESALCKRCLQKRWPHVYHFCVPPAIFSCDVCQLCFSKAMYLTVHKRLHQNDFRYACTEANCQEKFISRKLLLKHSKTHETNVDEEKEEKPKTEEMLQNEALKENEKDIASVKDAESVQDTENSKDVENKPTAVVDDVDFALKIKSETESIKVDEATNAAKPVDDVTPQQEQAKQTPNPSEPTPAETNNVKKHSRKRKKRAKESLEDLNLTAPNLSESGSSSESESETKSITTTTARQELALSPVSEHGEQKPMEQQVTGELTGTGNNDGNVLDIWKNFLQAQQQQTGELQQFAEYTEDDYPRPKCLHVCISDHDYCAMFTQKQTLTPTTTSKQHNSNKPETPSGRTRNVSTSSEASSDDSSSSSSCSCGSNCSCSNDDSTSSSSSDDGSSDSSTVSASKKRLRKKSERSNRHRKSFSSSPLKSQHQQQQQGSNTSADNINVIDTDDNAANTTPLQQQLADDATANALEAQTNLEPTINETDLETAESETDEEYYDEHPQKLATELLSQKRAQLMARTLLSPSHNFDIVENSRPSTPSLPEDVIYEKRQKKKKNKRDRKSTSNNNKMQATPIETAPLSAHETQATMQLSNTTMDTLVAPAAHNISNVDMYNTSHAMLEMTQTRLPAQQLQQTIAANHYIPRISEGSSCSDADNSLKRSKRQRRPNKFYGYTSDDESMAPAALGQTLVIGMRAYKPLPPPQLVWDKEDLPTPEKSILNVSNKKSMRQLSSTPNTSIDQQSSKKKQPTRHRKRSSKHLSERQKLPPIPTLKIRSALFNKSNADPSALGLDDSSDSASTDMEQQTMSSSSLSTPLRKRAFPPKHSKTSAAAATMLPRYAPNQQMQQQQQQQQQLTPIVTAISTMLPPTPQTTVFNHKIPPALLPNPDFSTLQYFKANNIRYPIRPPAGARAAREGESVYCYCRCPYDEVSEMIACDGDSCLIEWFHFECVGIMLAPQGKWFCAECRPQYSEELYPTTTSTASNALSTATVTANTATNLNLI